jgi:hypothetical protein
VSEGRTKKEEVDEAMSLYGLSMDDVSSVSDEDRASDSLMWQSNSDDEAVFEGIDMSDGW